LSERRNTPKVISELLSFAELNADSFDEHSSSQIRFALYDMPFSIAKWLLGSDEASEIMNLKKRYIEISQLIQAWDDNIKEKVSHVKDVEERLKKIETGFSFVGL